MWAVRWIRYRHGGLPPSLIEVCESESYARTTRVFANGGRSLYPEHMALYQAELAAERQSDQLTSDTE